MFLGTQNRPCLMSASHLLCINVLAMHLPVFSVFPTIYNTKCTHTMSHACGLESLQFIFRKYFCSLSEAD